MGYYIRILSTSAECVPIGTLRKALENFGARISIGAGSEQEWEQLVLAHSDGTEIAAIERNPVEPGSLGAEELDEFRGEIANARPCSSVPWLTDYFSKVRCIYACQLLNGTDHLNGWEIFGSIKQALWDFAPGIFQADGEGFSNEDGFHVLWQFSDRAKGVWCMAVLKEGRWQGFQMELGDRAQREAFLSGEIPPGAHIV